MVAVVVVVLFDFHFVGGARAWTRREPWYLPCVGSRVCCVSWLCSMCPCLIMPVEHGHGQGKRLGTCLVVKPCASYVITLQHHLRFLPKTTRYRRYALVHKKAQKLHLYNNERQHV